MLVTAGLGFKSQHLDAALAARDEGLWFEVHAENYMVNGGPRLAALDALRDRHPVALHGVGLSIASRATPDADHLRRLARLAERVQPAAISDHLAWQRWRGVHVHDFLPFPRTRQALAFTADNVARVQDAVGRRLLVENPSLYVDLPGHELPESEFLAELAARTGCGLLVDVNNVFVSAANLGFNAGAYLDALPDRAVGEIHLAGHSRDPNPSSPLLIDSHDRPVVDAVWRLYERLIARIGPRPTLIERDEHVPPFADLLAERRRAHDLLVQREVERAYAA
ncbi:MAG TPA: DUF692 domain-containing protein [Caulobacteraceae bacterium]|jgi:hypothetical protein|nr:DUF692 domain-containing protein [Caulobacteraceae bacterium]